MLKFNVDKCAEIHIGHNINGNYSMSNQQLPVTEQQRDLGIIITKDLKWQQQTEKSCKTANRVLGFIARNFKYKKREMMLPLYKSTPRICSTILITTSTKRYKQNRDSPAKSYQNDSRN